MHVAKQISDRAVVLMEVGMRDIDELHTRDKDPNQYPSPDELRRFISTSKQ